MSVNPSPIGGFAAQFFDNNGQPLSGGKIYTYAAGTTTPQATYTSATGVTPHANPIVLDSAGRVPGGEIWLTDSLIYKFVIETSTAILIGTYDNITGVNSNFVNYTVQEEVITATAGQTVFNLTTINYTPGTNSLSVYIDGVNQYVGDSYLETDSNTVTFTAGLHVGAEVKFSTAVQVTTNTIDAANVSYTPPVTGGVPTTVETKLSEVLSFEDLGAVGDGVTDDGAIINAKIYALYGGLATSQSQQFVEIHGTSGKTYLFATPVTVRQSRIRFIGNGATINCTGAYAFDITQDGSGNGNEEGTISNWKITGAATAAIRGRACNFWHITDNWITGNAIGIDVNGVEVEISDNYVRNNSSFGVVVQSAILVGGSVGESQRCIIRTNRIWSNGNYGLYLIDGGGHFVDGNDLENNFDTQLYVRCSFGNFINGLYSEAPGAANIILIDNTPALAVGRTSDNNQIIGGTFGGGATNDIQIVGGNNTFIAGVRYGAGNVVIGAACNNTTLLQQASPPIVSNNGSDTTDLSQIGISKWYASSFARIEMDATLAAGGAIGSSDNTLRHYGVAGLSANQNLPRNFVGFVDISGAATSGAVNFPANEPSAAYGIQLTVLDISGTPTANSHIAYATNRTASGFTVNLVAAPGVGNSVRVHWMIVQQ